MFPPDVGSVSLDFFRAPRPAEAVDVGRGSKLKISEVFDVRKQRRVGSAFKGWRIVGGAARGAGKEGKGARIAGGTWANHGAPGWKRGEKPCSRCRHSSGNGKRYVV